MRKNGRSARRRTMARAIGPEYRSSPKRRKIVASSFSSHVLTIVAAVISLEGSIRMSSGASVAYEKPRSGRSICIDETPMSSRIASALMSFAASWLRTIAKSPRRKRTSTPAPALKRSKCGLTLGSRSIATSLPLPARSCGEQAGVAAGAERRVDDRLAGLHGE